MYQNARHTYIELAAAVRPVLPLLPLKHSKQSDKSGDYSSVQPGYRLHSESYFIRQKYAMHVCPIMSTPSCRLTLQGDKLFTLCTSLSVYCLTHIMLYVYALGVRFAVCHGKVKLFGNYHRYHRHINKYFDESGNKFGFHL